MLSSFDGWAIAVRTDGYPNNQSIIHWDGISWKNVTSPSDGVLTSIRMENSSYGWAVGFGGLILRWDGADWTSVETPVNSPLESVDVVNANDAWAVGSHPAYSAVNFALHWNGTNWNTEKSSNAVGTKTLWSIDMLNSNDGWAVGDSGLIIRWNGTVWTSVASPTTKHLFSVDMISSTDGWAVGSDGAIIHWDGTSWNIVASPTGSWLMSISMLSATDGWIVGADGTILHLRLEPAQTPGGDRSPIEGLIIFIFVATTVVMLGLLVFFKKRRHKG